MALLSDELRTKLFAAQSADEVEELLAAADSGASAEQVWKEISESRADQELSLDELEAVSGGEDRDWLVDGCCATVEPGSWCGSNDSCVLFSVTYEHPPLSHPCDVCGGQTYLTLHNRFYDHYKCLVCGHEDKY